MDQTAAMSVLKDCMPYIVSIVCALISGIVSYCVARKQIKADIAKLEKQFQLDLEKERERFNMEKERMKIQHGYQMELQQKEFESTLMKEAIKNPDIKRQIQTGISAGMRQRGPRKH